MIKRTVIILLSIFIILSLNSITQAYVTAGACIGFDTVRLTACGTTTNSFYAQGAVELCGDCFACGWADGVCPSDFGANCDECCDPDCITTVSGYIFAPDGVTGLINAQISINESHLEEQSLSYFDSTDDVGHYSFQVPEGNCTVRVTSTGSPVLILPNITNGTQGPYDYNVTMNELTCTNECTSYNTYNDAYECQSSCFGLGGCTASLELLRACEGALPSQNVTVDVINSTHLLKGNCCDGGTYIERSVEATEIQTEVDNMFITRIAGTMRSNDPSKSSNLYPGLTAILISY